MPSSLTTPFRPSDIPTGLVGYWKFDNNANDSSASGYNLTAVNSPTYTANGNYWKDAYAGNTVGVSSQYWGIASASCPLLTPTSGNLTIATWIKIPNWDVRTFLAGKGNADYDGITGYAFGIAANSGVLYMNIANVQYLPGYAVTANKKTHLAVVFDSTANLIHFYVDGNLVNSQAATAELNTNTDAFTVGKMSTQGQYDTATGRSDTAIWTAALTPLQVKSLALGVDLSTYAYRPSDVSTQPTHWWKLNDPVGLTCADSAVSGGLVATKTGWVENTYAGGYIEGAGLDFEAADTEHLVVADSADWDLATDTDFCFAAWIKLEASAAINPIITRDNNNDYALYVAIDNTLKFDIGNANILASTATVPDATWTHVAVTRKSGTAYIYIDGIEVDNAADATAVATAETLIIGYDETVYFDGVMSDVCHWKGYAPTAAEIKSLACALPIQQQGIVMYSKMNGASGANEVTEIGGYTLTDNGTIGTAAGIVGTSRDFTPNDYFGDITSTDFNITTDMAMMCWLYSDAASTHVVFGKEINTSNYHAIRFGLVDNGGYSLPNFQINGTSYNGATTFGTAGFRFLGGSWDGAAVKNWIDGREDGSNATATAPGPFGTNSRIGVAAYDNTLGAVNGRIDELVIAKRYFRPEEIKAVYLKGLNGKEVTSSEIGLATSTSEFFAFF